MVLWKFDGFHLTFKHGYSGSPPDLSIDKAFQIFSIWLLSFSFYNFWLVFFNIFFFLLKYYIGFIILSMY